ncbi:MAG: chemotaxis protein CheX [Myxococcota bacterium]
MSIDPQVLHDSTEEIWSSVLGIGIAPAEPAGELESTVNCEIDIVANPDVRVAVVMPEPLARIAAAAMFGMEPEELPESDVKDAVGEIGNMISGSVKAALDEPEEMSVPRVGYDPILPQGQNEILSLLWESEGHPFAVKVYRNQS